MGNAYQAVNELIVELARVKEERDRYREALERIAQKDYHSITNNTRGMLGWIAEQALRSGEE